MSGRQTKTVPSSHLDSDQLAALRRGAAHFNHGRFFEAHEDWEIRWRKLPLPDRHQVQAAILVCGSFVLLRKGRVSPAGRLARLAVARFVESATATQIHRLSPALAVPEAEDRMLRLLARIALGESDPALLLSEAKGLQAVVHGIS
jgi:hypothetical protein